MFKINKIHLVVFVILILSLGSFGFSAYEMNWQTIDSGGGKSAGGNYEISGTIAQPDAGAEMTGGTYSLTGGFWSGAGSDSSDVWMLY